MGFEAGAIGHDHGSSHGATRLYRCLCVEHEGLVPLAERSAVLWRELEQIVDEQLLTVTGGVSVGPADSALPGLDPTPTSMRPCMDGSTSDHQFVVGRVDERLVVGGGCNGHGFKHAEPLPFADATRLATT